MKELSETLQLSPNDFYALVPMSLNRENRKADHPLNKIFSDKVFDKKFKTELSPIQQEYIIKLVEKVSEKFKTVSELRNALFKGIPILDEKDIDLKIDLQILGRLYK